MPRTKTFFAHRAPVLLIVLSYCLLALQLELRLAVPMLAGVTAVITMALAWFLYASDRFTIRCSPALILAVALLLRLMFLFGPPQLSDDIYRYVWDGSTLLHGGNPYAAAPATVTPPPNLKAIHAGINHPEYVTIYPPTAQIIFAGGAVLGGTVTGLKIFLTLIDLGLCAALILLLKRLEMPAWRAALYAWNPLAVLEIASSGHVDGAGLAMLLCSFCLLVGENNNTNGTRLRRWPFVLAGAVLAGACLVKLFPLLLVPFFCLLVPRQCRIAFGTGFCAALAALVLPFLPHLANMFASLDAYARNWEFAGFAFTTLRSLTGSGTVARMLLSGLFLLIIVTLFIRQTGRIKGAATPVEQARMTMAACYAIAMAFLLLTPTLQPWYALSLAAFLPFCAGPAGLVLCWAVFLTYQVQLPYFILGKWFENPYVTATVFLAPVTAWLVGWAMARRYLSGPAVALKE